MLFLVGLYTIPTFLGQKGFVLFFLIFSIISGGCIHGVFLRYPVDPRLVREVKLLGPLSRSIRSIERRLATKIITRMNQKLRDESIKSN
jgi:hypothetical protein